jgi:hypothetical protein
VAAATVRWDRRLCDALVHAVERYADTAERAFGGSVRPLDRRGSAESPRPLVGLGLVVLEVPCRVTLITVGTSRSFLPGEASGKK